MKTPPGTCRFQTLYIAIVTAAVLFASGLQAQKAPARHDGPQSPTHKTPTEQKPHDEDEGERVFAANCSRCHTAPDGFSTRISGTVVRHMRVRASLSKQDETALLHFLNP